MCNGFTGDDCTPQEMLNYLGSTSNGVAPVDMIFTQIGSGENSVPDRECHKLFMKLFEINFRVALVAKKDFNIFNSAFQTVCRDTFVCRL